MTYDTLSIEKLDEVYVKVHCERSLAMELHQHFTFEVPGARHMPAFKNKMWDGKIRLFNLMNQTIYGGLLQEIKRFAEEREYTVEEVTDFSADSFSVEEARNFINTLNLPSNIEHRDYQLDAFVHAVRNKRSLLISPTASGKSLIIYLLAAWYKTKTLIVVPTTGLVHQLASDFVEYGINPDMVHKVFSGEEKDTNRLITITTWQSIYKMKKPWYKKFELVIGDEAHLFKANSLVGIMTKLTDAKYRFGFTGTLDGTQTNQLVLEGLFGPHRKITTTAELIENKHLSQFKIKAIVLNYSDEIKQTISKLRSAKKFLHKDEIDFIVQNIKRNKFIRNLALSLTGNTLILYQFVEKQGKPLYNDILANSGDRSVFFVHGKVDGGERDDIRYIVESKDNAIIVASYGTFSTGVNIKRIHNIIFASPFKSKIKGLQSIGRGLRKGDNKQSCTLFDIADNLSWKSQNNITLNHFVERVNVYNEEKFDYKIYNVNLGG